MPYVQVSVFDYQEFSLLWVGTEMRSVTPTPTISKCRCCNPKDIQGFRCGPMVGGFTPMLLGLHFYTQRVFIFLPFFPKESLRKCWGDTSHKTWGPPSAPHR